jgi:hypothetical protein
MFFSFVFGHAAVFLFCCDTFLLKESEAVTHGQQLTRVRGEAQPEALYGRGSRP